MKTTGVLLFLTIAVVINGEVPARRRFQRIEQSPPYPASGFRPSQPFNLPDRQTAPKPIYGVPERVDAEVFPTDIVTTTEENPTTRSGKLKEREELSDDADMGVYYIYHPSGLLQKVAYATKNDVKNMAYKAEFKYQDVQPIADPVFTYDPATLVLKQVLV